jgi:tetratricopeptide (TPR) repeat protein
MNKLILPLLSLILMSCTTYVPVKYRKSDGFLAPQGTSLKINFSQNSELRPSDIQLIRSHFETAVQKDGWWKLASSQDKSSYQVFIRTARTSSYLSSDYISAKEEGSKERKRNASYQANGTVSFSLEDASKNELHNYSVTASEVASSESDYPEEKGNKGLLPVLNILLNLNPEKDASEAQNAKLNALVLDSLGRSLAWKMLGKITPLELEESVEFDDENFDMEGVKDFIKKKEFENAYHYLHHFSQKQRDRADVLYNLGVIQEARGLHAEGCDYYQRAYEMENKDLYLKQRAACLTRLNMLPKS